MALLKRKQVLADLNATLDRLAKDRMTKDLVNNFRGLKGRRNTKKAIELLADQAQSLYTFHTQEEEEPAPGRQFPFLRFLWDHREELLAFIKAIIGLFQGAA